MNSPSHHDFDVYLKSKNLALGFKVILVEIRKRSMMKTLIAKPS